MPPVCPNGCGDLLDFLVMARPGPAKIVPAGMPVWRLQGIETGTMTGYHSAAVIAEAVNKGFPGIDLDLAYKLMMKRVMVDAIAGSATTVNCT
jgi:putative alpha-1,2-mannosidase